MYRQLQAWRGEETVSGHSLNLGVTGSVAVVLLVIVIVPWVWLVLKPRQQTFWLLLH